MGYRTQLISRARKFLRELTGRENEWPFETLQHKWVLKISDEVLAEAVEIKQRSGMRLYCRIPNEMQKIVNGAWFDPYHVHMDRLGLQYWLTHHIFFDKYGDMVILHDHGKIMYTVDDFKVNPEFELKYGKDSND